MYNRYLNAARDEPQRDGTFDTARPVHPPHQGEESPTRDNGAHANPPHSEPKPPHEGKPRSGLLSDVSEALNGRLRSLHFDLDTLIIIIAVYFLIADSEDFDTDLLVLIGVLFVLGL